MVETLGPRNFFQFWRDQWPPIHSDEDRIYHITLVNYVNQANTTWKVRILKVFLNRNFMYFCVYAHAYLCIGTHLYIFAYVCVYVFCYTLFNPFLFFLQFFSLVEASM